MMEVSLYWHKIVEPKDRHDAPHKAIKITTGVGKSRAIRRMIVRFVRRARLKGLPHRVLYLVGTHKLAAEARIKMPNGVTTAIWQGRDAIKLGTADEKMCLNPEAVKAAIDIGAVIEETACRKARRGEDPVFCPFYNACHYQAQKALAGKADVVFAAHELLFKAPTAIGEDFGLVVIDEAFWQDGISGVAAKSRLVIDSLADELKDAPVRDYYGNRLDLDTEALHAKIELLQSALEQMPDGYVTRRQLIDAGLLAATAWENGSCAQAAKMEWARANVDPGLRPNSGEEDRRKAVKKFGFLKRIPKRWAMWKALENLINGNDDATGRLILETEETDDGGQRYIRVLTRKEILHKFASLPIVHLDVTMPFDLVKHFLPDLRLDLDLNVEAPHMHITQVARGPDTWPCTSRKYSAMVSADRATRRRTPGGSSIWPNTRAALSRTERCRPSRLAHLDQEVGALTGPLAHPGEHRHATVWVATRLIISVMSTVLPTPAPPNRPILPPWRYGVSRSMTLMPVANIWALGSSVSNAGGGAVDLPRSLIVELDRRRRRAARRSR